MKNAAIMFIGGHFHVTSNLRQDMDKPCFTGHLTVEF